MPKFGGGRETDAERESLSDVDQRDVDPSAADEAAVLSDFASSSPVEGRRSAAAGGSSVVAPLIRYIRLHAVTRR